MRYLVSFLEGIVTFLSPCLLPMLPIYVSYFAGGGQRSTGRTLRCALGFVVGFTAVFTAMGALAGSIGSLLVRYQRIVNLVSGIIVIVFGLNYLGLFRWNLFHGGSRVLDAQDMTFFSAALFGIIFSLGWTPCVGAFLGSALALATQQGHVLEGTLMLLAYSLGLGIPFLLSAVLIDALKGAFDWVKRHYQIINLLSGGFLILIGILMASGMLAVCCGSWHRREPMNSKKTLILAAAVLIVLLAGAYWLYGNLESEQEAVQLASAEPAAAETETTAPAMTAPDFTVYDLDGNPVSLSDYFGKPIVLNFWASWCGPCKMELPDFQETYDELGGDVQFLIVSLTDGSRETVETASAYLKEQGYTLPAYYDTQLSAAAAYGVNAIPCTYFIDAQGRAVARSSGAIDAQTLRKGIEMIQ